MKVGNELKRKDEKVRKFSHRRTPISQVRTEDYDRAL